MSQSRVAVLLGRQWMRPLLLGAVALVMLGAVGLKGLRRVGTGRGVAAVSLPALSEIASRASEAEYADAYRAPLSRLPSLASVERLAFQRGRKVVSTPTEVVYEGGAPGLRFLVSYYVTGANGGEPGVVVSTVVFYESWIGALYFASVKQVHKHGLPFIVSQMAGRLEEL